MEEKTTQEKRTCRCPYCDAEVECIEELSAVCGPCSITIVTCEKCGGNMRQDAEVCPECGERH
ncbi:MAG: hypothetical protein PHP28_04235 [Actinomycetota bacterium]|nr:hypothetical protein [Actinomycetota bacterium]MDD5665750.1 hypothetical protein [Actinomycetota bacterium]